MPVITTEDGRTYATEKLEQHGSPVHAADGTHVWLLDDAYMGSHGPAMEECYKAAGIDAAGHPWRIVWEIIPHATDDESAACDWDNPIEVSRG
jgi:hypothetical protein